MRYAPESVRIDVASTQYRVHRAVEELRSALDATATIPHFEHYAERGDTDLVVWSYVVDRMSEHHHTVEQIMDAVKQIDPYVGRDDFGSLEEPSEARDRLQGRGAVIAEANPFAPDPTTVGTAAFGVSRSITPDNPFADVFAARGTFGYTEQ